MDLTELNNQKKHLASKTRKHTRDSEFKVYSKIGKAAKQRPIPL